MYLYVVLQSKLADTWRGVDQLLQTAVQTRRLVLGSWPYKGASLSFHKDSLLTFLKSLAYLHLPQYLPQRHQPEITREGGCSHVTLLFFTRDCVNSILYSSWNSHKLLLSMLVFLPTVLMFFLPPDEFQADAFLKVAEKTILSPEKQTSPAVITEGGNDPNEITGCHTNAPLCPPTTTAGKLQQAAGASKVAGPHSKRLPAPCDGQPSPSASGLYNHVPLRMGHPTTWPLCSQSLSASSACASRSHTMMFNLKYESKLSFAGLGNVSIRWSQ